MKRLAALFLGFLVTVAIGAEVDGARLLALSGSVLKIEATRAQGGYSLGSGVVVAPDRVVTNCHVTRDALNINVVRGGARWLAASQRRDIEHDLCLLDVPGLQAQAVPIGTTDRLKPGDQVSALGYTGGLALQYSPGEVVALHRLDGGRVIQSSNWFSSGASGGGLFDEASNLVGILTFRLRGSEAHYFAAPTAWLKATLDAPTEPVQPDRSQRLSYWQRAVTDQPAFLQAARMERDQRWPDLAVLAADWTRADSHDAEAWYWMGEAFDHLERPSEARRALECSLAIEPDAVAARGRLEALYDRLGAAASNTGNMASAEHGKSAITAVQTDSGLHPVCIARAIAEPTR